MKYEIIIMHTRPNFSEHIIFLEPHSVITDEDEEHLKELFTKAFKEAHPEWTIKKVTVEKL